MVFQWISRTATDRSRRSITFLITEAEFDAVLERIKAQGLDYWADPARRRPREINRNDGGRGVYFPDPDGHGLEARQRPLARSRG